jgi:hypothetical protein
LHQANTPDAVTPKEIIDLGKTVKGLLNSWVKENVSQDRESQPEEIDGLRYTLAPSLLFEGINVALLLFTQIFINKQAQLNTAKKTKDSKVHELIV